MAVPRRGRHCTVADGGEGLDAEIEHVLKPDGVRDTARLHRVENREEEVRSEPTRRGVCEKPPPGHRQDLVVKVLEEGDVLTVTANRKGRAQARCEADLPRRTKVTVSRHGVEHNPERRVAACAATRERQRPSLRSCPRTRGRWLGVTAPDGRRPAPLGL